MAKRHTIIGKCLRDRKGASAVEFALVAPIFLALMFAIIEAGYFFFLGSAVDAANAKAARLIRTGQAQTQSLSRDQFFNEICNVVQLFGDCNNKLTVDVARFDDFAALAADASSTVCRDADATTIDALPFDAGAQRDIVRVRVCYLHAPLTPGIGLNLAQTAGGQAKLVSTAIFRNEPFQQAAASTP